MKRLKNEIFITIFSILTISFLIIITTFTLTTYIKEKNNISNHLDKMFNNHPNNIDKPPAYEEIESQRFLDSTVYTIILDKDNSIVAIISHSNENDIPTKVKLLTNRILKSNQDKKYIGNLYLNKYSYKYLKNDSIVIFDNTDINKELRINLFISLVIFIIFEIIAYIISNSISKTIIKPVEESFNKQKQFIADASHELKTPLAVILASSEALEKDNNIKWLKNIQNESERMNNLIKNLLDLAKLENTEQNQIYENNNISKTIEMAILPLESLVYEKNIKLNYNLQENIYLKSNNSEIKQLITILLDNAIKHSKGIINIELYKEKESIILKVENTGKAIPKEDEEKIFERFYRVDKSRNRNDNRYGLGLAIAKSIVERHKGTIKAYSKDGVTTFKVTFKK